MKNYFLITALLLAFHLQAQSQKLNRDSLRIDSLKKILPSLRDSARIDCLNALSEESSFYQFPNNKNYKLLGDSVIFFASKAYEEAKKIGYKNGIATSLLNLATGEKYKGNMVASGTYIDQAFPIAENIQNDKLLGYIWMWRGTIMKKDEAKYLEYTKKALEYFEKANYITGQAEAATWLCVVYSEKGKYEEGLEYCQKSFSATQKRTAKNIEWANILVQFSIANMAQLYKAAGDYETALIYYAQGTQNAKENNTIWTMEQEMGDLFYRIGKYDSAIIYFQRAIKNQDMKNLWVNRIQGIIYLLTKQYDKALNIFMAGIKSKENNYVGLWNDFLFAGRSLEGKKNYKDALKYGRKAKAIADKHNEWQWKIDSYDLLSNLYHRSGRNDSAYLYLKKHTLLKDSMNSRKFLWKLNSYKTQAVNEKKEAQISLLNKDNKIKEQQLKQETLFKKFLLAALVLFVLIGFFIFRNLSLKRKNEKLKLGNKLKLQHLQNEKKNAELQQRATELEMQALRAQMNPHFIFNCLNSINRFIFKNETREASDYLTRFSRLIRMVLLHSQKKLVPLEDELEMLKLYLDMERLRFKNAFDYHITTTNAIENSSVFIPPLLLQPFCENAIWHGLMHKEGPGHLNIELNEDNGILNCIITDDGVGREKAEEYKSKSAEKEKSMGLKITKERLSLLNQGTTGGTFYEIEDIRNEQGVIAGTKVKLQIKYKENVEELV